MTGNDNTPTPRPPDAAVSTGTQQTVTELVRGILDDVQRLAKQQVGMLKAEVREDMNKTRTAMVYGGLGITLLTVGILALIFGLVYLLDWMYPGMPLWVAWMIVGGIFAVAGFVLGLVARNMFESFNPLPDKTFNALQENLTWKTQPQA
ncbi:MAG TPA: phage holin family protein [Gemmataceae bacterium]|nr:phage holin family protein [Gemmataceae bacterium]